MRTNKIADKLFKITMNVAALCGAMNMTLASPEESAANAGPVTIGLIGDSTVAEESGWGPAFAARFNNQARILNFAKNGATLQSLSGRLDELLKQCPDYVIVQFGHNDQKRYNTRAYSQRLTSYIQRIQAAGGIPIVFSSVVRRSFDENGKIVSRIIKNEKYEYHDSLTAYALAAKATAEKRNVLFVDLHAISKAHQETIGPEASTAYDFKEGDRTHFNRKGAEAIAGLIIPALTRVAPRLGGYLTLLEPANSGDTGNPAERLEFDNAMALPWKQVFADDGTGSWKEKWFLDGEVGTVTNSPQGMTLTAGPEFKNDAHHMVLWTKREFTGDLKIEYDFTRTDKETRCVTILYIQATGSGKGQFAKDITKWNELRKVPAMSTYYDNMHTYHLSYAAFGNSGQEKTSYVRGRRYMPHAQGLKGTELTPDYRFDTLFATGVRHHVTVIKRERDLYLRIENPDEVRYCHLHNRDLPVITEGRIGLRHMFTRSARYENFRISIPDAR